eukprot:TCONS_00061512-protein
MQHSNSKRSRKRIDYRLLHHTGQVREKTQLINDHVSDSYSSPDTTAQVKQPIVAPHNQSDVCYNVTGNRTTSNSELNANSQYNLIFQNLPMDDQSSESEDSKMDALLLRQASNLGHDPHEQAFHYEPPPQDSVSSSHHNLSSPQHDILLFNHDVPSFEHDALLLEHDAPPPEHDAPPPEHDAPPPEHDAPPPEHDAPPPEHDAPPPEHDAPPPEHDAPPPEQDAPLPEQDISTSHHGASTSHHGASTSYHGASTSHHGASTSHHGAST